MARKLLVREGGGVLFGGRMYCHVFLAPLVGRRVRVSPDTSCGGAFVTVCGRTGEFICSARNERLWREFVPDDGVPVAECGEVE